MIVTQKPYFTNEIKREKEDDVKVIRKASIAREILKKGQDAVRIVDVKPDRDNKDRSCFVFRNDEAFQKIFQEVLDETRKSREDAENEKLRQQLDELQQRFDALAQTVQKPSATVEA